MQSLKVLLKYEPKIPEKEIKQKVANLNIKLYYLLVLLKSYIGLTLY